MGIGIAFTFIVLAALLAPVAWVLWWAAASVGTRTTTAHAVKAGSAVEPHGAARPVFEHPQPLDLRLPGPAGAIAVYHRGGAPVSFCNGPDAKGGCPTVGADGTVPCAGCSLVLPMAVRGSRDWHIPPGYRTCIVGSYAAFRGASAPV